MANIYLGKDKKGNVRFVIAGTDGLFLGHAIGEGEPTDPASVMAHLEVIGVPPTHYIHQYGVTLDDIQEMCGPLYVEHIGVIEGE